MSGKPKNDSSRSQPPKPNKCSGIDVDVTLYSPNPFVIAKLSLYDELMIVYREPSGPLLVTTDLNEVIGSILGSDTHELVNCIKKGFKFIGVVKSINGGNCTINVKSI